MASSSSSSKKITLKSSDGESFHVDENAALLCETIKLMIQDVGDSNTAIPLPNVTAKTLSKIIEYCNKHVNDDKSESEASKNQLKQWDEDFLNVNLNTLFDIVIAANYMDIKSLLEKACQCVADKIKDRTPEEMREIFNIKNDFTPKEEEEIRRENQWAFE